MINNIKYEDINGEFKVYNIENYDTYKKVILKKGILKYKAIIKDDCDISAGDYVYINGSLNQVIFAEYDNGFNYNEYLSNNLIVGEIEIYSFKFIKKSFSINVIHEKIRDYIRISYDSLTGSIMAALIIGDKTLMDDSLKNSIDGCGISHLFVISGLHMDIISSFMFFILGLFKVKDKTSNIIVLIVLLIYYILTLYSVSILRVILSFFITKYLSEYLNDIKPKELLVLNAIIMVIINPLVIFSYSFILSYTVVYSILFIKNTLRYDKSFKNYLINNIKISFYSTLISMPIIAGMGERINLLTVIYNLFFIPFVTYLILPISFIGLIKPLSFLTVFFSNIFNTIVSNLSNIEVISFSLPKPFILIILLFYLSIYVLVKSSNKIYRLISCGCIFLIVITWSNQNIFNLNDNITFLSLKEGESTIISKSNNLYNLMIDTGEKDSGIINYVRLNGIKRIDDLILTHSDSDHLGDLINLSKEIRIKNIYLNRYDTGYDNYIKNIKANIFYIEKGSILENKYVKINCLWPISKDYDVNNNSLVFILSFNNMNLLFTSDIEKEAEDILTKSLINMNIDILKVAHHGSSTSSSIEWVKKVNPKYAICMNGYYNTFGFPSSSTINTFNNLNIPIYNTIDYGSFKITFKNKKYYLSNSFKKKMNGK